MEGGERLCARPEPAPHGPARRPALRDAGQGQRVLRRAGPVPDARRRTRLSGIPRREPHRGRRSGSIIFLRLRAKEGISYSAGSQFGASSHEQHGTWSAMPSTRRRT
jgi:hypothetical protein